MSNVNGNVSTILFLKSTLYPVPSFIEKTVLQFNFYIAHSLAFFIVMFKVPWLKNPGEFSRIAEFSDFKGCPILWVVPSNRYA
ncbi:hypothetical protein SDC9_209634 [bioreactor metagenome]|uniref:Uncharacterized protein n=1 Tax=bioreactor metagenome TaxID=1076179 RepID=A0A645JDT9_9ZZZZ